MTAIDRLLHALFDQEGREHMDLKFFVGTSKMIEPEKLCEEALSAFFQVDQGLVMIDEGFCEDFKQVDVRDL